MHRLMVSEQLASARNGLSSFLRKPDELQDHHAKSIIGTYRAAMEPNLISWTILAYNSSRDIWTKEVLSRNIRDRVENDYPALIRIFSENCGVGLREEDLRRASGPVLEMWKLFAANNNITNVSIIAALEHASALFIPYLAMNGRKLGSCDFAYTDVCGGGTERRAGLLVDVLVQEMDNGPEPQHYMAEAIHMTTRFLEGILTPSSTREVEEKTEKDPLAYYI